MNTKRVARKIVLFVATLFLLVSLNFIIFRVLTPYEGFTYLPIWPDPPGESPYEWLLREYGLQQPLHIRYARYIINVFTFNFGPSFLTRRPVAADLWRPLQNTLVYIHLENALFKTVNDEFHAKIAKTPEEVQQLFEIGFEYVCDMDGMKFFRKRK